MPDLRKFWVAVGGETGYISGMKPLLFLFLSFIVLAACRNNKPGAAAVAVKARIDPDSPWVLNSLDTCEVFALLLDRPAMRGGMAIWHPNFSERTAFRVSYDDSCHTVIDTVLHFADHGNRECVVVVFVTYRYIADSSNGLRARISDCHSCGAQVGMALFSHRGDGKWELYGFQKALTDAGIFGGAGVGGVGEYSLVSIGDRWTALLLKRPVFANMGEEDGSADLYSIEEYHLNGFPGSPLSSIFSYMYHYSVHDEPGEPELEENAVLEVVKRKEQYAIVRLVTTKNGKRRVRNYRYSDEANSLVAVAKRKRS